MQFRKDEYETAYGYQTAHVDVESVMIVFASDTGISMIHNDMNLILQFFFWYIQNIY